MSSAHRDLAARFRTSIRQKQDHDQAAQDRRERQDEEAQRARDVLLVTLEEFADEADFFQVSRSGERLSLRYEGQTLSFDPDRASADVRVRCSQLGQECRLEYLPQRRQWQVVFRAASGRQTAHDLFPQGLEILISRCFGIRPAATTRASAAAAAPDTAIVTEDRRASRFFR